MTYMSVAKGLNRFKRNKRGVTAVEYAAMLAVIAGVIIVPVADAGGNLQQIFCKMSGATGGAACPDTKASAPAVQPISFPSNVFVQNFSIIESGVGGIGQVAQAGPDGQTNSPILSFAFYDITSQQSPWGAVASSPAEAATLSAACAAGSAPLVGSGFPSGPANGVPVVTTISSTSQSQLNTLGDNPSFYAGLPPFIKAPTFSASDSVVTCYAPK